MFLVIGGCGFIGSHVVDSLLEQQHKVRVFDRQQEAFRPPLRGVEYVMGDLSNIAQVYEALIGVDCVVHLASSSVPTTSNLDPVADITGNLILTIELLKMMRAAKVQKFIYLSSGGTVYGITETELVPETHPLRPINSYGIVKVAIEHYLYMEHYLNGLQYVTLRASNPYGPRQGHVGVQGIIGTHLWRTARAEPIEVWGDGSVVRDFIYVRDLADLCVLAGQTNVVGCYNAGSGAGTSVSQIVETINHTVIATGGTPMVPIYKPSRSLDIPRVVLDISSAKKDFDWTPKIPLSAGIAMSWDWVRNNI